MQDRPRLKFPGNSLLATLLGGHAPVDLRRAAQRLRAEGAPAVALDDDIAGLAAGLAAADLSRSLAVLEALPPLFWLEVPPDNGAGARGWIFEKKRDGLAARGFRVGTGAVPEPDGSVTVPFGLGAREEDGEIRLVRGLATAVSLPEMLSQMGEGSPILLLPADAPDGETAALRGFRLSVAISPEAAPS